MRRSCICRRLLVSAMLMAAIGCAAASAADHGGARTLHLAGAELGPFAYTHFCVRYPDECRMHASIADPSGPVALTSERRAELVAVNTSVNLSIVPEAHAGRGTYDTWTIAPARGDCNDFAVTKRHELLARGWPSRALLLTEVVTTWGDHHLVLVARTSGGDLVLDNLNSRILDWSVPAYHWVRAQMPNEPALWAAVATPARQIASRSARLDHEESLAAE